MNVQFLSSVGSSLDETIDIPMATGGGGASLINLICIKFKLKFISKFQDIRQNVSKLYRVHVCVDNARAPEGTENLPI